MVSRWRALECQTNKIGGLAWAGVMGRVEEDQQFMRQGLRNAKGRFDEFGCGLGGWVG